MQTQTETVTISAADIKSPKTIDVTNLPTMAEVERQYLTMVLEQTGGNKVQTAKILGLTVKTIYNKLNSYKAESNGQVIRSSP